MEKEEKILIASAADLKKRRDTRNILTCTGFLSMAEQETLRRAGYYGPYFGGYEDAERRTLVFLPDWLEEVPQDEQSPLCILRASLPKGGGKPSHRDYLGSLLALGVERSVIGDIAAGEDGADIFILREMGDFFLQEYTGVGRHSISCSLKELSQFQPAPVQTELFRDTVASLRLDCVAASAFRLSRGAAQELILQGLAAVNNRQILKPDYLMQAGDKLSIRGKGKAILKEVGGKNRKDRDCIVLERYK